MKTPFILTLKNKPPIVLIADVDGIEIENQRAAIIDEIPPGLTRNEVLTVSCFCSHCQNRLMLEIGENLSPILRVLDEFPIALVNSFIPTQEKDYSALAEMYEIHAPLFRLLATMQPHLEAYKNSCWKYVETVLNVNND